MSGNQRKCVYKSISYFHIVIKSRTCSWEPILNPFDSGQDGEKDSAAYRRLLFFFCFFSAVLADVFQISCCVSYFLSDIESRKFCFFPLRRVKRYHYNTRLYILFFYKTLWRLLIRCFFLCLTKFSAWKNMLIFNELILLNKLM